MEWDSEDVKVNSKESSHVIFWSESLYLPMFQIIPVSSHNNAQSCELQFAIMPIKCAFSI